jgi:hypothetical protein
MSIADIIYEPIHSKKSVKNGLYRLWVIPFPTHNDYADGPFSSKSFPNSGTYACCLEWKRRGDKFYDSTPPRNFRYEIRPT